MPIFHYKAKNKNVETIVGQIEAATREDAVEKIVQFGLIPVTVDSADGGAGKSGQGETSAALRFGRVTPKELYLFSRQFAGLLKAGIPILRALEVLSRQMKNSYFKNVIGKIRTDVQGGKSFSESISHYPHIFPSLYVSMAVAGEEGGKIHYVIEKVAEYLRAQLELRSRVKSALAYPVMMLICGIGAAAFILTSVMPKITKIFVDIHQDLPGPTVVVVTLSNFLVQYWAWVLVGILAFIFVAKQWIKTKSGQQALYSFRLRAPLMGEIWLKEDLARFARTMALLIESGVPVVRAMRLSIPMVSNIFIQEQLVKCQEELVAGRSFGQQIKRMSLIPDVMGDLISVGEEAGTLVPSLLDVAENYEQEDNDYIKIMTTLFEPLIIIVVGALIGFTVIAMLLPIFQMDIFAR